MKRTLQMSSLVAFAAMLLFLGSAVMAQDQPGQGGRGGDRGNRGDRGGMRFDPARMQEMMLDRIKENLKATDEEWTALKPLVAEVNRLRMNQMRGGRMMFGGPRRGGDQGGDRGPRGMQGQMPEQEALRLAVENESTPADQIKAKLEAYRAAVKKQEDELKAAREKLRAVVTPRQEASLVLMGILD